MDINLGGTFRSRRAAQTLELIKPLIKRAGISRIAKLTHLDNIGLPVYTCIRPNSENLTTSQGKGITDDLAMCSAYMEGIETFFSENIPTDILTTDSTFKNFNKISTKNLVPGYFSGEAIDKNIQEWTKMTSLLTNKTILTPTHYIKFSLVEAALENGLFKTTTTGLASGNTNDEAICHSIFEIIERNAQLEFDKLTFDKKTERAINLDSVDYLEAVKLIHHLAKRNVDVVVFDMTNQFNYPTYSCLIADNSPFRKLGHYAGAGTHAHRGIALCRALTEAVQSRLTYIAGSRDDMFPKDYKTKWRPLTIAGNRDYKTTPCREHSTIGEQLNTLIDSIRKLGMDILIHVHTHAKDPISVVKSIIPGLAI